MSRLPDPQDILLIKAHSMGIGDLLRASAAWSALKARWPGARLHLLMLSKHPGYPSESLMRGHHLLASAHFVTIKRGDPNQGRQASLPLRQVAAQAQGQLAGQRLDLVIDCESSGLRTAWLARRIARAHRAVSVGIAQFPLRRLFYDIAAPSVPEYARRLGLNLPMDYTERDFVALAALGIERAGRPIVLRPGPAAQAWQDTHPLRTDAQRAVVVLNIGCGTPDAAPKRPDEAALVDGLAALARQLPYDLHLTGADFEREIHAAFAQRWQQAAASLPNRPALTDHSGRLSLDQLTGLLAQADLVISSDSGPYHMAVGLGVPTLGWFNFDTPASYHRQSGVRSLIRPQAQAFADAALALLRERRP